MSQSNMITDRILKNGRTSTVAPPAAQKCAVAGNNYLPPELLSEVFRWARYSYSDSDSNIPPPEYLNLLTLVCRSWRSAALGDSSLWTSFSLQATIPHDSGMASTPIRTGWLPGVLAALRRSNAVSSSWKWSLRITITRDAGDESTLLSPLLDLEHDSDGNTIVNDFMRHTKHLEIEAPRGYFRAFNLFSGDGLGTVERSSAAEWKHLESLKLSYARNTEHLGQESFSLHHTDPWEPFSLGKFPSLRCLSLIGEPMQHFFTMPWTNLTELNMDTRPTEMTPTTAFLCLRLCNSLEKCSLTMNAGVAFYPFPFNVIGEGFTLVSSDQNVVPVVLPKLLHLTIDVHTSSESPKNLIMQPSRQVYTVMEEPIRRALTPALFQFPKLKTLTLLANSGAYTKDVLNESKSLPIPLLNEHSFINIYKLAPNIQELCVEGYDISTKTILNSFYFLSNLTFLSLSSNYPEFAEHCAGLLDLTAKIVENVFSSNPPPPPPLYLANAKADAISTQLLPGEILHARRDPQKHEIERHLARLYRHLLKDPVTEGRSESDIVGHSSDESTSVPTIIPTQCRQICSFLPSADANVSGYISSRIPSGEDVDLRVPVFKRTLQGRRLILEIPEGREVLFPDSSDFDVVHFVDTNETPA